MNPLPLIESPAAVNVSVAAVVCDGRWLLSYNDRWSAFTLPQTKPRRSGGPAGRAESPRAAAVRAAEEILGRPIRPDELPGPALPLELFPADHPSGRDGARKLYFRKVFLIRVRTIPFPGRGLVWLGAGDLGTLSPLSPTAAQVVRAIVAGGYKPGFELAV